MTPDETTSTEGRSEHRLLDAAFDTTILLKGLDGLVEVIGGVLLLVVSPSTLHHLAVRITQYELSQDPHDFVATHLLQATATLGGTRVFGAVYLLSHGLAKVVLVVALWRNRPWAYPAALGFLGAFIGYQAYRLVVGPTVGMWALTAFDLVVMALVWREYQLRRTQPARG